MPPRPLTPSLPLARFLAAGTHAALLAGAPSTSAAATARAARPAAATTRVAHPAPALSHANLDTTCAPCRDFFRYANGGWLKRTTIPAAYPGWGSFDELAESNQETLYRLFEGLRRRTAADSDSRRLAAYWAAAMDSNAADAAAAKPIQSQLDAVNALPSKAAIASEVAWLHSHGIPALFSFRAAQDPGRSEEVIAIVGQGGIGLPDRDYYTRTDSVSVATRAKYVEHIVRSFELLGMPSDRAKREADQVMAIENALANASMTNVQRRDPRATYHKMPLDSARALAPLLDWNDYLARRGAPTGDSINVTQPDFFRGLNALIAERPLGEWQAYLRWKIVDEASPLLSRPFAEENFRFQRLLSGAEVMQPRWKRSLDWATQDLGDLVGTAYVRTRFSPAARARALVMVRNLEAALGERIEALDWMQAETRRRAIEKLQAFENKIGYPDHPRDYTGVTLSPSTPFANRLSARAYESRRNIAKIGKPVDRGEWNLPASIVNAFYSSSLNSINFPAGILQAPFYDPAWDDAMNYGGIGAVIGHEMTHGFDDRGRQFDAKGNLRDWWTEDDATRYKQRANRVADQFSSYTVLDTIHLNGRLTLGENIADLGGVAVAYAALERALAGKPRTKIDGFTPEQRFFLSWAQVWRNLDRPEALRTQVQTDPHSPAEWRVNGPLSNLPEFAKAFGCKPGDAMVRPDSTQARIW